MTSNIRQQESKNQNPLSPPLHICIFQLLYYYLQGETFSPVIGNAASLFVTVKMMEEEIRILTAGYYFLLILKSEATKEGL